MQYTTVALGAAIIVFGIYTAMTSIKTPDALIKLKYMRKKLGMKTGTTVHTVAYVVVPLIFGYFVLSAGIDGVTITKLITDR